MSYYKTFLTLGLLFASVMFASSQEQSKAQESKTAQAASSDQDLHEMLFTDAGLLAFDTPKDWERTSVNS
jgi:hypothetical protein